MISVSSPKIEVRIIASGLEFPEGPVALPDGYVLVGAPGYALFDSMKVNGEGWVCQAMLIEGGITQISPDGQTVETLPLSDPMITNLCFGGPTNRTAFITCSGTGHLIAVDWPRAGGRLAFPGTGTT